MVPIPYTTASNEVTHPSFISYPFEWAGLENGYKKVALFYLKKSEISSFNAYLETKGYFAAISDFAMSFQGVTTTRTLHDMNPGSLHTLYVSKEKHLCKRLKLLDYYHQFQKKEPSGLSGWQIFFEIGSLLGYPACCSNFLHTVHNNPAFSKKADRMGVDYTDETLYPMLALQQTGKINSLLNNLSEYANPLINFFVCSYDCKHALRIADQTLTFIEETQGHTVKQEIMERLRTPLLFFSPSETLFLPAAYRNDDRIWFQTSIYKTKGNQMNQHQVIMEHIQHGTSMSEQEDKLVIFRGNEEIYAYTKKHPYDGTFIQFDE